MTHRRIAVLIDGAFFLKRLPRLVKSSDCDKPDRIAVCIRRLCKSHVRNLRGEDESRWMDEIYRIFFYDAVPYDGKAHHPLTNALLDFGKTEVARFRTELFDILRRQRKVALRLGKVNKDSDWTINPRLTKKLVRTRLSMNYFAALGPENALDPASFPSSISLTFEQVPDLIRVRDLWLGLSAGDVALGLKQKGVDMRIGIDIAHMVLKRHVDTIVLVAGDSDFVPAAKLARREGVQFILDPLWQQINDDLHEHIDGLFSGFSRPRDTAPPLPAAPVTVELPDDALGAAPALADD